MEDHRIDSAEHDQNGRQLHPVLQALLFAVAFVLVVYVIRQVDFFGDYVNAFYPAAQRPLDPYSVGGFFNAPWLAWIIWPLTVFPPKLSAAIWVTLSIVVSIWCYQRLDGGRLGLLLFLTAPTLIRFIVSGEVEAVPLLGLTLLLTTEHPDLKGLGLLLLGAKPTVLAAGAVVHWLHLDRRSKWRVLPVPIGVLLFSFLLYGLWPLEVPFNSVNKTISVSLWPYGIVPGLLLLAWAARRNRPRLGALSTYLLVPYISPASIFAYVAVLFASAPNWLNVTVYILLWALTIYTL